MRDSLRWKRVEGGLKGLKGVEEERERARGGDGVRGRRSAETEETRTEIEETCESELTKSRRPPLRTVGTEGLSAKAKELTPDFSPGWLVNYI